MHYLDESHILLFLVQFFVLLLGARGLGEVLRRWRQPALTAELLVGVVLGPTVLGRFFPGLHAAIFPPDAIQQTMLETVAWIGVLFLLLETGLEIDFSIAWRQRGGAMVIALSDIVVPMVLAFAVMVALPGGYLVRPDQRIAFSLFMATALTISAMPVTARAMQDLNLLKTELGFLTMSALAVNDVIGWVLFTFILGLFTTNSLNLGAIVTVLLSTCGFAALVLIWGRRVAGELMSGVHKAQLPEPGASLTVVCLAGILFGTITQWLGVHALFGFFLAGVAVGQSHEFSEQTRGVISQMVHAVFVPLFFASIGLKVDFAAGFDTWLVVLVTGVGMCGRYVGAWLGVTMAKVPKMNRDLVSIGHVPGGMMEVVVALLAMEAGVIGQPMFVAIVFGAVFSSVVVGPWMSFALSRRRAVRATDFITTQLVAVELEASDREGVINELVSMACRSERSLAGAGLERSMIAREQEFGTAIGSGVAIPHCRMDGLAAPILAYGGSERGIEWDAPDGELVHHVFLLITPTGTGDVHVQIIAQIAWAMNDPALRRRLLEAGSPDQILQILREAFSRPAVQR